MFWVIFTFPRRHDKAIKKANLFHFPEPTNNKTCWMTYRELWNISRRKHCYTYSICEASRARDTRREREKKTLSNVLKLFLRNENLSRQTTTVKAKRRWEDEGSEEKKVGRDELCIMFKEEWDSKNIIFSMLINLSTWHSREHPIKRNGLQSEQQPFTYFAEYDFRDKNIKFNLCSGGGRQVPCLPAFGFRETTKFYRARSFVWSN